MIWSQVNSLQMQPSPVNKWYNATQNWRKNKSTTLFADQIHTYDCTQYCIIECLKLLIIYDDTPLKVCCETKYTYTTKSNRINRNEIHIHSLRNSPLDRSPRPAKTASVQQSNCLCWSESPPINSSFRKFTFGFKVPNCLMNWIFIVPMCSI